MTGLFSNPARLPVARRGATALRGLAIALALLFAAPVRAGERRRSRSATSRSCMRKRPLRASTTSTTAPGNFSSAAAARRLIATARASPASSSPAARIRAKLFVNKSTTGGPLKFEEKPLDIGAEPHLLENVIGAYPLDISGDGHMDLFVLRVGAESAAQGRPRLHVHARQQGMGVRRRPRLDDVVRRRMGEGPEISDPRDRPLRRPQRAGLALGHLRGEFALSSAARRQAGLFRPHAARARLLRALDAVHRLEPLGHAFAARLQRSAILSRRRGADVADRARQDAETLFSRRRLAARLDLRHGHRRGRHRRLRLSRIRADFDGRHQAAEARSRRGRTRRVSGLPRHRRRASARPRTLPYAGGDKRPSTGWHSRIRRFQQRRPARPVHLQGQCRADARFRRLRSQQSAARPMERQVRRSRAKPRASRSTGRGAAR